MIDATHPRLQISQLDLALRSPSKCCCLSLGGMASGRHARCHVPRSGVISQDEFGVALAKLGWQGDAKRLFKLYDTDGGGSITLGEIDAEACALPVAVRSPRHRSR